jgi:hypothetical protein
MITEEELVQEEQDWAKNKQLLKRKIKIEKDKKKLKDSLKDKKELTTTKLLVLFLFLNCTLIELFTSWATVQSLSIAAQTGLSPDFSPLVTLIGAVVGEVIGFGVYAVKSVKENTVGGIIYDSAMNSTIETDNNDNNDSEDAVG